MAKAKSDLEHEAARYRDCVMRARDSIRGKRFDEAMRFAMDAIQVAASWVRHTRHSVDDSSLQLEALEILLRYAPALLDYQLLNELDSHEKSLRRLQKNLAHDLTADLANARSKLNAAYRLWTHLEAAEESTFSTAASHLNLDVVECRDICGVWIEMELLRPSNDIHEQKVQFATDLTAAVRAKCGECGTTVKAKKAALLEEQRCPKCNTKNLFCIVGDMELA